MKLKRRDAELILAAFIAAIVTHRKEPTQVETSVGTIEIPGVADLKIPMATDDLPVKHHINEASPPATETPSSGPDVGNIPGVDRTGGGNPFWAATDNSKLNDLANQNEAVKMYTEMARKAADDFAARYGPDWGGNQWQQYQKLWANAEEWGNKLALTDAASRALRGEKDAMTWVLSMIASGKTYGLA